MPKTKKIPTRMCIACREMKPKLEMTRVVKTRTVKFLLIQRVKLLVAVRIFAPIQSV